MIENPIPSSWALRDERPDDRKKIYAIEQAAFGRKDEADLVNRLRKACPEFLSLVAEWGQGDGGFCGTDF